MTIFGVKNQIYSIYLLFPQGFPLLDWIPEPKGLVGMTVGGRGRSPQSQCGITKLFVIDAGCIGSFFIINTLKR